MSYILVLTIIKPAELCTFSLLKLLKPIIFYHLNFEDNSASWIVYLYVVNKNTVIFYVRILKIIYILLVFK